MLLPAITRLVMLVQVVTWPPAPETWSDINSEVVRQLDTRDIGVVLKDYEVAPGQADPKRLLTYFDAMCRAGHETAGREFLPRLAAADPLVSQRDAASVADWLIRRERWELARAFVEQFPLAEPGTGYVLPQRWQESGGTDAEIDAWLAGLSAKSPFWLTIRARFLGSLNRHNEVLAPLERQVRANPTSLQLAMNYLDAAMAAGRGVKPEWMGDVCRPKHAFESARLGGRLCDIAPTAAIPILEHSLRTELTEDDRAAVVDQSRMVQVAQRSVDMADRWQRVVRDSASRPLLAALQAAGRAQEAQKLMQTMEADQRTGLPTGVGAGQAGQIQAAAGTSQLEDTLKSIESKEKDSAQYWFGRANYFVGRGEVRPAEEAFDKALALAIPDPQRRGKDSRLMQSHVLRPYLSFRAKHKGVADAYELLWHKTARLDPETVGRALDLFAFELGDSPGDGPQVLRGDDQRLWDWLTASPTWSYAQERILLKMAENPGAAGRDEVLRKAESLIKDQDSSRAKILGWVMTRIHNADRLEKRSLLQRAIPVLQYAYARVKEEERTSIAHDLLHTFLELNDFKQAIAIWPDAREGLDPGEWLAKMAIAAARGGEKDAAMEFWRQLSNRDRLDLGQLNALAAAGCAKELQSFYAEMKKTDPQSIAPDIAAEKLAKAR